MQNATDRVFVSLIKMHWTKLHEGYEISSVVIHELGKEMLLNLVECMKIMP